MKIFQFNTYNYGSTGYIMNVIADACNKNGIEHNQFFIYSKKKQIFLKLFQKIISFITKLNGKYGFVNKFNSRRLIKRIKKFRPHIVVLHNFHDNSIDCKTLFSFLSTHSIKTVIVLHDCWAFTGYCPNYFGVNCEKWKSYCNKCPLKSKFSWLFDNSKFLFESKKNLFNKTDLYLVAVSDWVNKQCKMSFLKDKPITIISNPVNLMEFKSNNAMQKQNKKNVLGVAFDWNLEKGAEDFNFLANNLPDDYVITVVGVDSVTKNKFCEKIRTLPRLSSKNKLAQLYSSADVFVNASKEESFGLTNIEALACGTPVVTYDVGGTSDTISPLTGILVKKNDKEKLLEAVKEVCNSSSNKYKPSQCLKFAQQFDSNLIGEKYITFFKNILDKF